ncbi:homoaconitase [Capsaspora owczarzaki ATCC 30864]|nr:homoaconitase [Capsaspora owczarzaki ATCC 30864]|eukprot:XP_004349181.2 homoaconitase [Capsaspora owczarzaki ATCC 30864]
MMLFAANRVLLTRPTRTATIRAFQTSALCAWPGQNLVEKIAQKYATDLAPGETVRAGDYLSIQPEHVMTHDNTSAVMSKFASIGGKRVFNPTQIVFTLDHNVQDKSQKNLDKYRAIEEFAAKHKIDFYPAGRGIGHQVMVEEGYAFPNTLVVASDSHSNMYGGIGCLGTPVVRTDAAAIWATGKTWWQVPPVARVHLTGRLRPGVTSKDIIITLCGVFNKDEVLNHAIEFTGDGIEGLTVEDRLTIANMTTEWGALAGVFPVDGVTVDWLRKQASLASLRHKLGARTTSRSAAERFTTQRLRGVLDRLSPDADAFYAKDLYLDLGSVSSHVSGPNHVKVMQNVASLADKRVAIHRAYIVSCVNSRMPDLAAAASVLRGRKVAEGVRLYIAAASSEVQNASEAAGDWQTLVAAGATPLSPGCGPCIGLGTGLLEDGEVGISATNRNFKGRMGSRNAVAYLASPAVVAASAAAGFICGPEHLQQSNASASSASSEHAPQYGVISSLVVNSKSGSSSSVAAATTTPASPVTALSGFPTQVRGRVLFCHQDNLNTDGIYPAAYTYREDMTPELQAKVVMENYDPQFGAIAHSGDILVGGFNFGTGSSREQAATALKHKGIGLVVAGSFSETYKRNAVNNGLLAIEAPELVEHLKAKFGTTAPTVRLELEAVIDFTAATMTVDGQVYSIPRMGLIAQELMVVGGLENWVKAKLEDQTAAAARKWQSV